MLHCLSPHPTSVITLFFKYTATTDIYTLSLHDALPIFIADARNFQILAVAKISATTRETRTVVAAVPADADALPLLRSEEHTSELQSLTTLVCRLLLEKKKKQKHTKIQDTT